MFARTSNEINFFHPYLSDTIYRINIIILINREIMSRLFLCILLFSILLSFASSQNLENENDLFNIGATASNCTVLNCDDCPSQTPDVCSICSGTLTFDGTQCSCLAGSFLVGVNQCQSCIDNCIICSTNTNCDQCFTGYYFDGSQCSLCSSNCESCTSTECQSCETGYELNGGVCQALSTGVIGIVDQNGQTAECPAGCSSCSTVTTCDTCSNGFFKEGSVCSKCNSLCLTCEGTENTCKSCPSSFILVNDSCLACQDSNCIQCSLESYCVECAQGYGSSLGICNECVDKHCLKCAEPNICLQCAFGSILHNSECVQCLKGCGRCDESDISICHSCQDGFYNVSGICTRCPDGCEKCSSNTNCENCQIGYELKSNMCYPKCSHPCSDCTEGSPSSCTSCFAGYTLNGKTCDPDTSCSSDNSCTVCPRGYYLASQTCGECSAGVNCARCSSSDNTVCTQCIYGHYLDNEECLTCPAGCQSCSSTSYCYECQDGYFMMELNGALTGKCYACDAEFFCKKCVEASNQCTQCFDGYSLIGAKCISNKEISISLTLDISMSQFVPKINGFKSGVVNAMGKPYEGNPQYMIFSSLKSGSVITTGSLAVPDSSSKTEAVNSLESVLTEGSTYGDVKILRAVINDGGTSPPTTVQSNLPLILGISIPLLLILLSLILVIKFKSSKDSGSTETNEQIDSDEFKESEDPFAVKV